MSSYWPNCCAEVTGGYTLNSGTRPLWKSLAFVTAAKPIVDLAASEDSSTTDSESLHGAYSAGCESGTGNPQCLHQNG
jgi:hypothetical protein